MNESSPAGSELSRRSLVKTAATAAAAGGALVLGGPAVSAQAAGRPEQLPAPRPEELPAAGAAERHEVGDGVMVRVIDVRTGALELYTTDGHRMVVDRALALQIARLGR